MDIDIARSSLGNLPRTFRAKNGHLLKFQLLEKNLHQQFVDAYLTFLPRNSFQGLPPLKDEVCVKWVREMIGTGINLIATCEAGIVGHTALFPLDERKCEMLVVVWPRFQNLGIGTELSRSCVLMAAELGFRQMWLPVEAKNLRARHIYAKCGFEYKSPKQSRELDMFCDLDRHRAKAENASQLLEKLMDNTRIPPCHFDYNLQNASLLSQTVS
jgi:RimJ/RimL family protein N-acetyltransferase